MDYDLGSNLKHLLWPTVVLFGACACAQTTIVTGSVEIARTRSDRPKPASSGAVIWLVRQAEPASETTTNPVVAAKPRAVLKQKNKLFEPHVIVVPVGAEVNFPNHDPFFHNVFSLYEGKRFDLGLYEAGSTRSIRFDRAGISYLFCNIHSEMSAVIIALETPYYATSDRTGQITIPGVPPGRYMLHVWREGTSADSLRALVRPVVVSGETYSFGKVVVPDSGFLPLTHKNKYGQDYESPNPPGLVYEHP